MTAVAAHVRPGCLVVVESTVGLGTTDTLVRDILELRSGLTAGAEFNLAHSPQRIDLGNRTHRLGTTPKVVGGLTPACAAAAETLYRRLCPRVAVARSTREAEFAKLLENAYRAVNIALVNDLAVLAPMVGVHLADAIACAATKPFGFQPFHPGPGIGGPCLPTAVAYLRHAAVQAGHPLLILDATQTVNDRTAHDVVHRATQRCAEHAHDLTGRTILLLGVTYKPDVAETRNSPAEPIARLLRAGGAVVSFHDPYVSSWGVDGHPVDRARDPVVDAAREADLTILLQHHQAYVNASEHPGADLTTAARTLLDIREVTTRSAGTGHVPRRATHAPSQAWFTASTRRAGVGSA